MENNLQRAFVIGGGVIGLTQAIALQQKGYSVTVFEAGEVGKPVDGQASGLHAGLISPTYATPPSELNLGADATNHATVINLQLGLETRAQLMAQQLPHVQDTGLLKAYFSTNHILQAQLDAQNINLLANKTVVSDVTQEPLPSSLKFGAAHKSAVYVEHHTASFMNINQHVNYLAKKFQELGGTIENNRAVQRLSIQNHCIDQLVLANESINVEGNSPVVFALGNNTTLLSSIGYSLPLHRVLGYGVELESLDITKPLYELPIRIEPGASGSKCGGSFGTTPTGENMVRVAGGKFSSAANKDQNKADMLGMASFIYPGHRFKLKQIWHAERPYSIDGIPVVGVVKSLASNAFINMGHGGLGTTQSLKSAQLVADQLLDILSYEDQILLSNLSPDRASLLIFRAPEIFTVMEEIKS